jgi:hypothetical protein
VHWLIKSHDVSLPSAPTGPGRDGRRTRRA